MSKKLYVGNLPYSVTEGNLRRLFEQHGTVHSVNVVEDRDTGRPRGFAFVEMDPDAADNAINALAGSDFGGRSLNVNEAKPRATSSGAGRQRDSYRYWSVGGSLPSSCPVVDGSGGRAVTPTAGASRPPRPDEPGRATRGG